MTSFEKLLLRYLDDYITYRHSGCQKYTARAMGVVPSTLCTWMQYYHSNGTSGSCPQLRKIGLAMDSLGVPIIARINYGAQEPGSNLTTLEKMVFGFIVTYIDKHRLGFEDAGKMLGLKTPRLMIEWMNYYTSDGYDGVCPKIDAIGVVMEKIGVTVKRRQYND